MPILAASGLTVLSRAQQSEGPSEWNQVGSPALGLLVYPTLPNPRVLMAARRPLPPSSWGTPFSTCIGLPVPRSQAHRASAHPQVALVSWPALPRLPQVLPSVGCCSLLWSHLPHLPQRTGSALGSPSPSEATWFPYAMVIFVCLSVPLKHCSIKQGYLLVTAFSRPHTSVWSVADAQSIYSNG